MRPEELIPLLRPFMEGPPLSPEQLEQVSAYLALLVRWNAKTNLTAVRAPEQMVSRHFGESFFAAAEMEKRGWLGKSAIDLGSGAGFPGLPLAIYSPQTEVTLIESQNKKTVFLKEVVRALGLRNVTVFAGRGEEFDQRTALVTMRAVEKFAAALPVAARLLAPEGTLGLLISAEQAGRAYELLPDYQWEPAVAVPESSARILLTGKRSGTSEVKGNQTR